MVTASAHRRTERRSLWFGRAVVLCAMIVAVGWAATTRGQDAEPAKTESQGTSATSPAAGKQSDTATPPVIYWIDDAGRRIPVLRGAPGQTLEQVLQGLQNGKPKESSPAPQNATVTRMEFDGEVDGERAALTASFTIQVTADDAYVRIPLQLPEATITGDTKHDGPGESIPGRFEPNEGYTWWLRGKGEHQLQLPLSVPVEARSPKSRLLLTLPTAAVSQLTLQVPQSQVTANVLNKDARSQPVIEAIDGSKISVLGLGTSFELTWQSAAPADSAGSVLEVDNTLAVDFDNDSVFVKAQQKLLAIEGTPQFDTVRVDLPAHAKLNSLHGPDVMSHAPEKDAPQTIRIQLNKPTSGPVVLNWNVELEPQDAASVVLEGFHVHEAVREKGQIGLRSDSDRRLDFDRDASKHVRRIDVTAAENVFDDAPDSVFRFSKQPFQLVVGVRKVEPQLTATSQLYLTCSGNSVEFEGIFRFRVAGGEIDTVNIDWPDWRKNGWVLQPFESRAPVAERFEEGNRITYRLSKRAGSTFAVRLRAQRTVPDDTETLDFDLPAAEATRRQPAVVVVAMHDNVQMEFEPEGETDARLLSAPLPASVQIPEIMLDRRPIIYEVVSLPRRFTGKISTHKKSVQTSTIVKLIPTTSTMNVRQTISYTVAWGRQAALSLLIPTALKNRVTFFSDTGVALTPTGAQDARQPDYYQVSLPLDNPRTRRFHVTAVFDIDEETATRPGGALLYRLPVIKSLDSPFATTIFEAERASNVQVQFEEEGWRPQTDIHSTPTWSTSRDVADIPVTILRTGGNPNDRGVVITKALARTVIDSAGIAATTLIYDLKQTPDDIEVTLPEDQKLDSVTFNGRELLPRAVDSTDETPGTFVYTIPTTNEQGPRQLVMRYHSTSGRPPGFSGGSIMSIPHIAGEVWAGRSVWEVELPRDQILFVDPAGYTSQNRWTRTGAGGFLWERTPEQSPTDLAAWLDTDTQTILGATINGGNRYQFTRLAPLRRLSVQTMSWPMVVGIGSGLSLILGLMFQYVPAARNMLVLLFIGFLLSVAGIWYMTPVVLLLQASVLGLGLALVSALIQGTIRRRRSTAAVPMPSGSGFGTAIGSSFEQDVIGASGSKPALTPPRPAGDGGGSQSVSPSTVSGAPQ